MNYKKKYKEALKRAKSKLHYPNNPCFVDVTEIFPELKESEDEKIRKSILELVKQSSHILNPMNQKSMIAWLEKQGESYTKKDVDDAWLKCICDAKRELEKQGEKDSQAIFPTFTFDDILALECSMKNAEKEEELYNKLRSIHDRLHDAYWTVKQGEPQDKGEISDGYHTFNELYYYRILYNAAFFNMLPKEWVHKSKKHNDGEECFGGGWFIVIANLPTGQISNHYELKDWDLFQIPEKEVADKWDGHTPQEAADRLYKYLELGRCYLEHEKQGEQKQHLELKAGHWYICHRAYCCRADHLTVKEGERFMCEEDGVVKGFVIKEPEKYFIEISTPADNLESKFKVGDKVLWKYDKTVVRTITDVSDYGTYWIKCPGYSSGWWSEQELEPYVNQDEQKSVIEPKFKVGDWVVYDTEEWWKVLMVDRVNDGIYHLIDVNGEISNALFEEECNMRLWSIGDAKDGDVLVFDDIIMIFKNIKTACTANTYILYCNGDGIVVGDWCDFGPDAQPATKEQCDLLFQKMKDAGYEWDSEKKKLKKVNE